MIYKSKRLLSYYQIMTNIMIKEEEEEKEAYIFSQYTPCKQSLKY